MSTPSPPAKREDRARADRGGADGGGPDGRRHSGARAEAAGDEAPATGTARRWWGVWGLACGVTLAIVGAVSLPPLLGPAGQAVLYQVFEGTCHQVAARSLHWMGVPLAVCDRCFGVYAGLAMGAILAPTCWAWQRTLRQHALPLLLLGVGVAGLDWIGPIVGLWPNVPASRLLTGGVLGAAAGLVATHGLLRAAMQRTPTQKTSTQKPAEPAGAATPRS